MLRGIGRLRAGGNSLESQVAALYASGEQGAWYDPSDLSTLSQTSTGTLGNVAVGDPVGYIGDKSGRGNHAKQATAGSRPTLRQDAGGKYYLDFDGGDSLSTSAIDLTGTSKVTVFAGAYKSNDTGTQVIVETGINRTVAGCFGVRGPLDGVGAYDIGATGATGTAVQTSNTTYTAPVTKVLTAAFDISQAGYVGIGPLRVNGVAAATTASGAGVTSTGNFGNQVMCIGAANAGATFPLTGRIYGLIVRGAASTAAQIASGEAWVNGKTGAY